MLRVFIDVDEKRNVFLTFLIVYLKHVKDLTQKCYLFDDSDEKRNGVFNVFALLFNKRQGFESNVLLFYRF